MCSCADFPAALADPQYWSRDFPFAGLPESPRYFAMLDVSAFTPPISHTMTLYCCTDCKQAWHVECAPEEVPEPIFAMKLPTMASPHTDQIQAQKHSLSVLAHGGFDVARCISAGCPNGSLKGRAYCHLHMPFP